MQKAYAPLVTRLRKPLILQAVLVSIGGASGWLTLPYDVFLAFLMLLMWLALVAVVVWRTVSVLRAKGTGASKGFLVLVAVLVVQCALYSVFMVTFRTSDWQGSKSRFFANSAKYESTVRAVSAQPWRRGSYSAEVSGTWVELDVRDTTRISLEWDGWFSNWEAIVYGPTDAVAKLTGAQASRDGGLPELRSLFGGYLSHCKNLSGHYYYCGFG